MADKTEIQNFNNEVEAFRKLDFKNFYRINLVDASSPLRMIIDNINCSIKSSSK